MFQLNQLVEISTNDGPAEAIITRVWNKPASDPYVTVRTTEDQGRTFVRCSSTVHAVTVREQAREAVRQMWNAAFGHDPH